MRTSIQLIGVAFICLLLFSVFSFKDNSGLTEVFNLKLRNANGKPTALSDYKLTKGLMLVFTCNHCPFAKLYPGRFNELNKKYSPKGVPLIAISSTDTITYEEDGFEQMKKVAGKKHFNFDYLFDDMQILAKKFGADKTPHAFLLWKNGNDWQIRYSGAIDDNGAEPDKVTEPYLAMAVDSMLMGKEPPYASTKSIGCQIHFRPKK